MLSQPQLNLKCSWAWNENNFANPLIQSNPTPQTIKKSMLAFKSHWVNIFDNNYNNSNNKKQQQQKQKQL